MYRPSTHFHFIGIGGIGMSALATILKQQGYHVSGCDQNLEQKSIKNLLALGCTINNGNGSSACFDHTIDALVYSSAIRPTNPELVAALERGIPVISRAQLLAELMKQKFSIAVAGSHGKTTTSSLISHTLIQAHTDPTIIIGGHLSSIGTNGQYGSGRFLVAEADESDRSCTLLNPTLAIITNIDLEHLDTYRDINDIIETFKIFVERLPWYGKAIVCVDDANVQTLISSLNKNLQRRIITYGFSEKAQIRAQDYSLGRDSTRANISVHGEKIHGFTVQLPGIHNLLNALATIAVCYEIGLDHATIGEGLATFSGVEQRFTFRGTFKGADVFDDYGHHPTEIAHVVTVARQRTRNNLVMVFQPHRFSRTEKLWNDFIDLFSRAPIDTLIITDIFPASEQPLPGITSETLVTELRKKAPNKKIIFIPLDDKLEQLQQAIEASVQEHDLLLFQGAGKINKLSELLSR